MASTCIKNAVVPFTFSDPNPNDFIDFEFHHNDPVAMITADELFSGGKLVPLNLSRSSDAAAETLISEVPVPETPLQPVTKRDLIGSLSDHFAVSPKAPTCSIRWREFLRLKRQQQTKKDPDPRLQNPNPKCSRYHLLSSHPLHKHSESESVSISSRHSLSSTSSGRVSESDDPQLPRHYLDSEHIPNQNPILLNRYPPKNQKRVSGAKAVHVNPPTLVDSPRMNASGKVVFNGLGRSSSSPSTCGARAKQHSRVGMERSYSANVRVTPVLNVPVCSLRGGSKGFGFGQLFSGSGSGSGSNLKNGGNKK